MRSEDQIEVCSRVTQVTAAYVCGVTSGGFAKWDMPRNADGATFDLQKVVAILLAKTENMEDAVRLLKNRADAEEQRSRKMLIANEQKIGTLVLRSVVAKILQEFFAGLGGVSVSLEKQFGVAGREMLDLYVRQWESKVTELQTLNTDGSEESIKEEEGLDNDETPAQPKKESNQNHDTTAKHKRGRGRPRTAERKVFVPQPIRAEDLL